MKCMCNTTITRHRTNDNNIVIVECDNCESLWYEHDESLSPDPEQLK